MDEIPGFPFLHKVPPQETRTKITCQNCGVEAIIEKSLWVNEYTGEQHIWCQNCTTQIGMWHDRESPPKSPPPLPDST